MSRRSERWCRRLIVSVAVGLGGMSGLWGPGLAPVARAQEPVRAAVPEAAGQLFTFDARNTSPRPTAVFLAGSFNGWNPTAEPMKDDGSGLFTLRRELAEGVHFYKFVVDGRWTNDPLSDKELEQPDGHGGVNSAILVGPDARKLPPPPAGDIRAEAVRFELKDVGDFNVVDDKHLRVSLRLQAGDAEKVVVWVQGRDGSVTPTELARAGVVYGLERWSGLVRFDGGERGAEGGSGPVARLVFTFADAGKTFELSRAGVAGYDTQTLSARPVPFREPFEVEAKVAFSTPGWTRDAVWYQIFPERFRNGDTSNDPGEGPWEHLVRWQSDWWKTQPGETPGAENFYKGTGMVWQRRYGGDIQGVREKLPYLRSLGINAIYLNPIFEATSMHKYDARDFRHIDDNFTVKGSLPTDEKGLDPASWTWTAGDKAFLDFVAEAHRQGFKVVIDLVANHVGRDHPFFQDVLKRGKDSPYAEWFDIRKFADVHPTTEELFGKPGGMEFKAWDGMNGHLPVFKHDPETGLAKGPYEHMMAVTRRWLAPNGDASKGVDGFRLDVANEVPHAFWKRWREVVKQTKPEAIIIGEIWSPAQPWLKGDQFDGVMNYQFAMAGRRFVMDTEAPFVMKPSEFERELWRLVSMYPLQAAIAGQNLYDSHDTDRMASKIVNPNRPYDGRNRLQDPEGEGYEKRKPNADERAKQRLAVALQMTFLGAPMVYYGSEAGMWGPDDPSNRMPMVWKDLEPYDDAEVKFEPEVFEFYRRAIAVRRTLPALREGFLRTLHADDATGVVAFARTAPAGDVIVVLNRSGEARTVAVPTGMAAGTKLADYLAGEVVDGDDGRPVVKPGAARLEVSAEGTVRVELAPWGSAVLAAEK